MNWWGEPYQQCIRLLRFMAIEVTVYLPKLIDWEQPRVHAQFATRTLIEADRLATAFEQQGCSVVINPGTAP